jgi:hypothetical protein
MLCNQQCRPKYGITNRCFLCEGHEFYSISGDSCISCSGSFILSSKECVSSEISGLYKLGDIYYKECPSYSNRIGTGNQCNCENRYYEEGFNGKIKRTCLSPTSACPTGTQFYDFGDKKCYSGPCNTGKTIKKYETNGDIRCHSSCVGEEFYKDIGDSDICIDSCDKYICYDSDNKKYCKDDCSGTGLKKKNNLCVNQEDCNFYDDDLDYCLNSCEESGGKLKHNFGSKKCISSCAASYAYEKNNICYEISSCNFIQEVGEIKKCLSTCNEGFIAPDSVTSKKCYNSCEEYNSGTHKYFNYGENICMEKCSIAGNSKVYR